MMGAVGLPVGNTGIVVGVDGVETVGKFGFAASSLGPPASFWPQETMIVTQKTHTAKAVYFMEKALTAVKIRNYLNKAKSRKILFKNWRMGKLTKEMRKKINISLADNSEMLQSSAF